MAQSMSGPMSDGGEVLNWWLATGGTGYTPEIKGLGRVVEPISRGVLAPPSRARAFIRHLQSEPGHRNAVPPQQLGANRPPGEAETIMLRKRQSLLWSLFVGIGAFGYSLLRRRKSRSARAPNVITGRS
jgi:hypothetical protein